MQDERVLFHVSGLNHLYNMRILQERLPELRFQALLKQKLAKEIGEDRLRRQIADYTIYNGQSVEGAWSHRPALLCFSTANPEPFRCRLMRKALHANVPVLALEEVHQLANNNGVINHYFLPVDRLGTASFYEAAQFEKLGFQPDQIIVTGWPFYSGNKTLKAPGNAPFKRAVGNKSERPIAVLILSFSKERRLESAETFRVRRQLLAFAACGLPQGVRLAIKPHPADNQSDVEKLAKRYAPEATVLDCRIPIEEVIALSDLIICRGNSQVMFEAMLRGIPVAVVPLGLHTVFHDCLSELIAETPEELQNICTRILRHPPDYSGILSQHAPYSPEESLDRTAALFRSMIANPPLLPGWRKRLDLCLQMKFIGLNGEVEEERNAFLRDDQMPLEYRCLLEILDRLFEERATIAEVENLLHILGDHEIRQWHIQALWIRQLYRLRNRRNLVQDGLPLVKSFNGIVNPHYFIHELIMRMILEYMGGTRERGEHLRDWLKRDYYFLWNFQKWEIWLQLSRDHRLDARSMRTFVKTLCSEGWKTARTFAKLNVYGE